MTWGALLGLAIVIGLFYVGGHLVSEKKKDHQ